MASTFPLLFALPFCRLPSGSSAMLPLSYKKQSTGQQGEEKAVTIPKKEKSFQKTIDDGGKDAGNQREQNNSGQICRNTYNF